jgi:hypothetical protein
MPRARLDNSASPAERDDTDADLLRRNRLAASSVLVLGAGLRLYGLNLQSAWADEIARLVITDPVLTFGQFWQLVIADVHPPRIVKLTSVERQGHQAEYAITPRQPPCSIDLPPRLGRSGVSSVRRDGVED